MPHSNRSELFNDRKIKYLNTIYFDILRFPGCRKTRKIIDNQFKSVSIFESRRVSEDYFNLVGA
jgi:hypothetical protein